MRRRWVNARSRSNLFIIIAGSGILVLVLLLSVVRFTMSTSNAAEAWESNANESLVAPPPFSLLVTLTFSELPYKEQFLLDIAPLCQYIRQYESNTTLSYEVLLSDNNPLQVLVLERYADKESAYLQIHKSSAAFLKFRAQLQEMQENGQVTVQGASYVDAGIGYVRH